MATLQGGVSVNQAANSANQAPPLTASINQTVSPGTASAGGNVFNQTYAPDISVGARIPTLLQALAPMSPMNQAPLTVAPPPGTSSIPGAGGDDYFRVSPSLQGNVSRGIPTDGSPIVIRGVKYSPEQLYAQMPGADYMPGYSGVPMPQQQPVQFQQPQRPQYAMAPRQLVDPNLYNQIPQYAPTVARTTTMNRYQGNLDDAIDHARMASELSQAQIAPPPSMQRGVRGNLTRAFGGLTLQGRQNLNNQQKAYYKAVYEQPQHQAQAANVYREAAAAGLNYERQIAEKNATIVAGMIEKIMQVPTASAQETAIKDMFRQWPNEKDPVHMDARIAYAAGLMERTGIDILYAINLPAPADMAMLTNRNETITGKQYDNQYKGATLQDRISSAKSGAEIKAIRADVMRETKDAQIQSAKLNAQLTAAKLLLAKQYGASTAQSLVDSRYQGIASQVAQLDEIASRGYKQILQDWANISKRYLDALNDPDAGDLLSLVRQEMRDFGPVAVGTEKEFAVDRDENGNFTKTVKIGIPKIVMEARAYFQRKASVNSKMSPAVSARINKTNNNGFVAPPTPYEVPPGTPIMSLESER